MYTDRELLERAIQVLRIISIRAVISDEMDSHDILSLIHSYATDEADALELQMQPQPPPFITGGRDAD